PARPGRPARSSRSRYDTRGAPWPPAAMSRARTSETTGTPVRSAIQAGWPSWSVPRARPSATQWDAVGPGEPISAHGVVAAARSPHACPVSVSRAHTSPRSTRFGGSAARMRALNPGSYGRSPTCVIVPVSTPASSVQSTTALSMPSWDVPEMRPRTRMPSEDHERVAGFAGPVGPVDRHHVVVVAALAVGVVPDHLPVAGHDRDQVTGVLELRLARLAGEAEDREQE